MSTAQVIYLLSDATGETAEKMVLAALTQFRDKPVRMTRINNVRTKNQVYEALDEALSNKGLVVYTIVNRELAQLVHDDRLAFPYSAGGDCGAVSVCVETVYGPCR